MKLYNRYSLVDDVAALCACALFFTAYSIVDTSGDPNLIRYLVSVLIETVLS